MDYVVQISEQALMQIHLAALESYLGWPRGQPNRGWVETIGYLWGHEIRLAHQKTLYSVQYVSIDTNATRRKQSATSSVGDLEIKKSAIQSFWPHLEFLGDFHTHPNNHYVEVIRYRDWEFSRADFHSVEEAAGYWLEQGYRVGLVMAVAQLDKRSAKAPRIMTSQTWEWTLGNLRFWLAAYVAVAIRNAAGHFEGLFLFPRDGRAPKVQRRVNRFGERNSVRLDLPRIGGFPEFAPFKGTSFDD